MSTTGWESDKTIKKYASEDIPVTLDCTNQIPALTVVTAVSVRIYNSSDEERTSTMIIGTPTVGNSTSFRVAGGTEGIIYKIKALFTLNTGSVIELVMPVAVIAE